ncbi:MAG: 23S rRNA (uracil(1939)-C(5))-methyltransferase RlmD [Syntrophotaleaceae bacterium]
MARFHDRNRKKERQKPLPSLDIDILYLNEDGLGVGRHSGKEVLVGNTLPGERVSVRIEHEGQRRLVGRLQKVLKASTDRIAPPCPLAGVCQGCSLIQMDYQAQLIFKETRLREALGRYNALLELEPLPIQPAARSLGYRTNAKLVFSRERGDLKIGLYRRGTHQVVDIGACPLHHPLINRIMQVVKDEVQRQKIFIYDPLTRRGLLRYLLIKVAPASGKAMVTFVTAERDFRRITPLGKWLQRKVPEVVSVQQNVNSSTGNVILGRDTMRMLGVPDLIDQVGDVTLRISPTSFFQVNHEQAAYIYRLVRSWSALAKHENALDLYCGIGGIALHLAADAGKVTGIEVVEEAVRNARENARINRLENCTFLSGDAAELVGELAGGPVAVAVVNPPRTGCDANVLEALTAASPRSIIYVSCNPATLGRDLDLLHEMGFQVDRIQPVDMFPQTVHLETVVRLLPAK